MTDSQQHASVNMAIQQLDSIFTATVSPSSPTSVAIKKTRATKREALAVSTPALMALLPNAKKRRIQLSQSVAAWPVTLETLDDNNASSASSKRRPYRPNSLEELLERLSTYSMVLWNDGKPLQCSAVAFAGHGWRATGKKREQVTCEACEQVWEGQNSSDWQSDEGKRLGSEIAENLSTKHARSCPWRSRPCPEHLYRLPISLPANQLLRQTLERASTYPAEIHISISHPLIEPTLEEVRHLLGSGRAQRLASGHMPSEQSMLCSLFGWQASSSTVSGSSSLVLQCSYCTRRLLARSQAQGIPADQSASPDKLSTINLRTAHRRFCAYVTPATTEDQREGWEVLLHHLLQGFQHGSAIGDSEAISQPIATRETLDMVKELLQGGRMMKRRAF